MAAVSVSLANQLGFLDPRPGALPAQLVARRSTLDLPLEYIALAWFASLSAGYVVATGDKSREQGALDRCSFVTAVVVVAVAVGLLLTQQPRPWLVAGIGAFALALLLQSAGAMDQARRTQTTPDHVVAYPRIVLALACSGLVWYCGGIELRSWIQSDPHVGYRQASAWVRASSQSRTAGLASEDVVRVVAFVDERRIPVQVEAFRSIVSAFVQLRQPVVWEERFVTGNPACESREGRDDLLCRRAWRMAILTSLGHRDEVDDLRRHRENDTPNQAVALDDEAPKLLVVNRELARRAQAPVPAVFVDGISLAGVTPDSLQDVIQCLLDRRKH